VRLRLGVLLVLASSCGEDMPAPGPTLTSEPESLRADLIEFVFRGGELPTSGPDFIERDATHELFADVEGLARIDVLRFDLDFGLWSSVYEFWPESPNGQLILYHVGHFHGLEGGRHVVRWLVARGYTVMFAFMPLFGENPVNVDVDLDGESFTLRPWHDDLGPLERRGRNVFHLFFEPIYRAFTYAMEDQSFEQVAMVGLSGGGWTTDIYSALDPRVETTYSISGSLPFRLRTVPGDLGEFEQLGTHRFYDLIDYMGIYFLAARGAGQRHRHLMHQFDECCFAWDGRADAFRGYEASVRARLERDAAGGDFRVELIPDLVTHNTSVDDLEIIDREMQAIRR